MSGSVRLKAVAVGALVALFAFLTFANFVPKEQRVESPLLPDDGLRWGLDLQGGIHWVVGVELDDAIERELEFVRGGIVETLSNDPQQPTRLAVEGLASQCAYDHPLSEKQGRRRRTSGLVPELPSALPRNLCALRRYRVATILLLLSPSLYHTCQGHRRDPSFMPNQKAHWWADLRKGDCSFDLFRL